MYEYASSSKLSFPLVYYQMGMCGTIFSAIVSLHFLFSSPHEHFIHLINYKIVMYQMKPYL